MAIIRKMIESKPKVNPVVEMLSAIDKKREERKIAAYLKDKNKKAMR